MMKLPEKTVERLSQYRRSLLQSLQEGKTYIFSHELANLHHFTAVQVRRDIMLMGYTGQLRKGYDVKELAERIGNILDIEDGQNVAVFGMGSLGKAISSYFIGKRSKLRIVASFDVDPNKTETIISGIECFHINDINRIIQQKNIKIAILTLPPEYAKEMANKLVIAGIKGILNYTSVPIQVPINVFLEEYDMITSVEKVAYFVKQQMFE